MSLPFFPSETKLINSCVGFFQHNGTVNYLLYGKPILCHKADDRQGYRYALANLIVNHQCTIKELSDATGEARKNIERYAKSLREKGMVYFFNRQDGRGQCHKMTGSMLVTVQGELDQGRSMYRIAQEHDISESAISYHIRKGTLKKKTTSLRGSSSVTLR